MPDAKTESDSAPQVTYHEDNGHLILANALLEIALSEVDGTIVSLIERETKTDVIITNDAGQNGYLWRLLLVADDGDEFEVTNRDCVEFAHELGRHHHEGALQLWLQWRGFRAGSRLIEGKLTAQVTLPEEGATVLFEEEVELPEAISVHSLSFPCVCEVSHPDPATEDALVLPQSGGILLPNPRALAPGSQPPTWEVAYPGPGSLQFVGYAMRERTTLWLAAHDPSSSRKSLVASRMASSGRLALWITHHPVARADGHWSSGYASALGLAHGDWFEAAREYRTWAAQQPWAARGRGGERILPPLTTAYGLWASYWGGARRCVSSIRELLRIVNVPIKVDWRCWHNCARNGAYPDYLPPRDGEEAWATAEQQLGDSGVLDQVSINALLASSESVAWQEQNLAPNAVLWVGDTGIGSGGQYSTANPKSLATLRPMCPGAERWRHALAAVAREVADRGADGILLEDSASVGALECRAFNHDHPAKRAPRAAGAEPEVGGAKSRLEGPRSPAGGPAITDGTDSVLRPGLGQVSLAASPAEWTINLRDLLTALRDAVGAARQIAMDDVSEPHIAGADAFFCRHASAERLLTLPPEFGHRWSPIPLFTTVYHDYTTVVGPPVSLVSQHPNDPVWPMTVIAEMREPQHIMQRDYQVQFCLEVARAVVWGYNPMLEGFAPEQVRDDSNRHKLAFLAAALRAQAWGIGALLPQSQFMGPISVQCPSIEVEMLVNPLYSSPSERLSYRRSFPSVLASAWRVPGGGLAVIFVNIHSQTIDFTARLRSSRLRLQFPLRLIGRTFSEDGDVPAASLGSSGSEISGKLPGRAITLVSLR